MGLGRNRARRHERRSIHAEQKLLAGGEVVHALVWLEGPVPGADGGLGEIHQLRFLAQQVLFADVLGDVERGDGQAADFTIGVTHGLGGEVVGLLLAGDDHGENATHGLLLRKYIALELDELAEFTADQFRIGFADDLRRAVSLMHALHPGVFQVKVGGVDEQRDIGEGDAQAGLKFRALGLRGFSRMDVEACAEPASDLA